MHIPDNYLSPETCAVMGAVMVPVLAVSVKKVKEEISKARMPQLGIGAAFVFLIMMFNIPVPGGTSVHVTGAVLLAALLGPYSAVICLTTALLLQALLFGDGGILALGANTFNMAFVMPFVGYFVYKLIRGRMRSEKGALVGLAIGSYVGLNVSVLFTSLELGLQPLLFHTAAGQPLYCPYPLSITLPAMLIPHLTVAGIAEALFTVAVFSFIKRVSPGMVFEGEQESRGTGPVMGLVVALVCLSPLGLLATGAAWGEWGAGEISEVVTDGEALGFVPLGMQEGFQFEALLPDYSFSGLPEVAGYILSAVIGAALLVIIFRIVGSLVRNKSAKNGAHNAAQPE